MLFKTGVTDVSILVEASEDAGSANPGDPKTGLLFSNIETGGSASWLIPGSTSNDFALVTQTIDGAHTDGGFVLLSDTLYPGVYRLDLPDAIFVSAGQVVVQLIAAGANNCLFDSIVLEINAPVDTVAVSGDVVAADNLELQYDTTGLTGDTFPATQIQLDQIANVGAAVNTAAESYVLTTGTQSANTVADTAPLDGVHHEHTDDAGAMDLYYQFDVGSSGVPVSASMTGRLNSANDDLEVYAYNWAGTSWDRIGTVSGTGSSFDSVSNYTFFTSHVGTGVNKGKVRVRFTDGAFTLTSATLRIDQIFVSYSIVSEALGYEDGAVWVDTINGVAGTTAGVNGIVTNPVDDLDDARTIADALNLKHIHFLPGSTSILTQSFDAFEIHGVNFTIDLDGQSISGTLIDGANVSGVCTGAIPPHFEHCEVGNMTVPPCHINSQSGFTGTLTLSSAGDFFIVNCSSFVAGSSTPTIDLGASVGASDVSIRGWSGGLILDNVKAGDNVSLEGMGGTVTVNGDGGEVFIRGIFDEPVDNSSAAVTIDQVATINRASTAIYANGIWIDTNSSNTGVLPYVDGTADKPVGSIADAYTLSALVDVASFRVVRGSSFTLAANSSFKSFVGTGYTIALGGQDIEGTLFTGASISGIGTGGSSNPTFLLCGLGDVTLPPCNGNECGFFGTFTIGTAGSFTFGASSEVFGTSPIINYGAFNNASQFNLPNWTGGSVEIQNAGNNFGTYTFEMNGNGNLTIHAACSATTQVTLRGNIGLTNNASGITIVDGNRFDVTNDIEANVKQINDTTVIGTGIVSDKWRA